MNVAANNPVLKHAIIGGISTLGAGALSLPVSAMLFDGPSFPDNLPLVASIGMSAGAGAGIAAALPGMAGRSATRGKAALIGLAYGAAANIAGIAGWLFLLGDR